MRSATDIIKKQTRIIIRRYCNKLKQFSKKTLGGYYKLLARIEGATYSDSVCKAAFIAEMNKYASRFGMSGTQFVNSSGQHTTGHYSCARDLAKMVFCCTAYEKLMQFWGQASYSVEVGGGHARTITGSSTYKGAAMETVGNYYFILGGKSGTWNLSNSNRIENLVLVCKSKVDDAWLAGCIMYNTNNPLANTTYNRGIPFRQMLDWLEDYRVDPTVSAPSILAQYCSAFVVPSHNPIIYQDVTLEMVGKSSTTQAIPASCTKLMTAMVALDHLSLDETVMVKASDIQSGSGDTFYEGDTINAADAILTMLLPSSNTLATTIARVVGERLLAAKNNNLNLEKL